MSVLANELWKLPTLLPLVSEALMQTIATTIEEEQEAAAVPVEDTPLRDPEEVLDPTVDTRSPDHPVDRPIPLAARRALNATSAIEPCPPAKPLASSHLVATAYPNAPPGISQVGVPIDTNCVPLVATQANVPVPVLYVLYL